MQTMTTFWHFARGMAFASTGQIDEAEAEHKIVAEAEEKTPEDAIFAMPVNNKTKDILRLQKTFWEQRSPSPRKTMPGGLHVARAVKIQDGLKYNEPPDWFFPVREPLERCC